MIQTKNAAKYSFQWQITEISSSTSTGLQIKFKSRFKPQFKNYTIKKISK